MTSLPLQFAGPVAAYKKRERMILQYEANVRTFSALALAPRAGIPPRFYLPCRFVHFLEGRLREAAF